MSKRLISRTIPLYLLSAIITLLVAQYFIVDTPQTTFLRAELLDWGIIIAAFGMFLGSFTLILVNIKRISRGSKTERHIRDIVAPIAFFLILGLTLIIGTVFAGYTGSREFGSLWKIFFGWGGGGLVFLMEAVVVFYAFRIRSIETFFFLLTGVLSLLRATPFVNIYLPLMSPLGDWLLTYVNSAATSASIIAVAISAIILSIRAWAMQEAALIGSEAE